MNKEKLWFSTSGLIDIDGVVYRPSICYPMPPLAKKSLEKLAEKGKVKFYTAPVFFANGVVYRNTEAMVKPSLPATVKAAVAPDKTQVKQESTGKKIRKEKEKEEEIKEYDPKF